MKKNETGKGTGMLRERALWEGNILGKYFRLATWISVERASPFPPSPPRPSAEGVTSSKALRRVHAGVMEEQQGGQRGWDWLSERHSRRRWGQIGTHGWLGDLGGHLHRFRIWLSDKRSHWRVLRGEVIHDLTSLQGKGIGRLIGIKKSQEKAV